MVAEADDGTSSASPSLAAALRRAVGLRPEVHAALARVVEAEANLREARSGRYPGLTYGATTDNETREAVIQVGVSQLVYDHGQTRAAIKAARATVDQQVADFWRAVEKAIAQAALDYVALAQNHAVVAEAHSYLDKALGLQKKIESRVSAGVADQSDALVAQIALNRAQSELDRALAQEAISRTSLATSASLDAASVQSLDALQSVLGALAPDSGTAAQPAVRAAQSAVDAAVATATAAKARTRPPVRLVANYDVTGSNSVNFGLEMAGSFLSGGGQRSRVLAAEARVRAAEQLLSGERIAADGQVVAAGASVEAATLRTEQLREIAALAEQSASLSWQEYQLNKRQLDEVTDSERQVFTARVDVLNAVADGLRARIRLIEGHGQLYQTFLKRPDHT